MKIIVGGFIVAVLALALGLAADDKRSSQGSAIDYELKTPLAQKELKNFIEHNCYFEVPARTSTSSDTGRIDEHQSTQVRAYCTVER
jgi:hypothetical protein